MGVFRVAGRDAVARRAEQEQRASSGRGGLGRDDAARTRIGPGMQREAPSVGVAALRGGRPPAARWERDDAG